MSDKPMLPPGAWVIIGFHIFSLVIWFFGQTLAVLYGFFLIILKQIRHNDVGQSARSLRISRGIFFRCMESRWAGVPSQNGGWPVNKK